MYYVYQHIRPDTGCVFYIGKGTGKRLRQTSNRNIHWKRIVAKAGGFESVIVSTFLLESDALKAEIELIAKMKSDGIKLCNLTIGGDGVSGLVHTQESKLLMGLASIGRAPYNKGCKTSPEIVEKLRAAKLGKKQTAEHVANMVAAKIGKPLSESTRRKIAISNTGKRHPESVLDKTRKRVTCVTTGEVFKSVAEAAQKYGLASSNISRACKGVFKQIGGFQWQYASNQALSA